MIFRDPVKVIRSCVLMEQLPTAIRFAELWMKRSGFPRDGAVAKAIRTESWIQSVRLLVPLGRAPGEQDLENVVSIQARGGQHHAGQKDQHEQPQLN